MRTRALSRSIASELDPVARVVVEFEDAWRGGQPSLERFRNRFAPGSAPFGLAELVLADLQIRYKNGQRPTAREYLQRFPELAEPGGRALSLIYGEYCHRVEAGEAVDPSEFCLAYPTWRDSLSAQLGYHQDLSRMAESGELPDAKPFPEVGDRFGGYLLAKRLGQGASATVFLATDPTLGDSKFVIKITSQGLGEAKMAGPLDFPHIVQVTRLIEDEATGLRGLVMPYRAGLPLDRVMRRLRLQGRPKRASALRDILEKGDDQGQVAQDSPAPGWSGFPDTGSYAQGVAWIVRTMALALKHSHRQGIIHRDVKPDNILLTSRDGPLLLDFNLAHNPNLASLAIGAHRGGTLPYMAREHLQAFLDPSGWPEVGVAADIFSLGLVLREFLTLEPLYRPSPEVSVPLAVNAMLLHRGIVPEPVRRVNGSVPHALEAIVSKCLSDAPIDRYRSAEALADDLGRFLSRRPLAHTKNRSLFETTINRVKRRRKLVGSAFLVLLVVASVIPANLGQFPSTPPTTGPFNEFANEATTKLLELAADHEQARRFPEADIAVRDAKVMPSAILSFRKVADSRRESRVIRMGLAELLSKAGKADDSLAVYREVIASDANFWPAYAGMADVYEATKRTPLALEAIDNSITLAMKSPILNSAESLPNQRVFRCRVLIQLADNRNDAKSFREGFDLALRAEEELRSLKPAPSADATTVVRTQFAQWYYIAMAEGAKAVAAEGLHQHDRVPGLISSARASLDVAEPVAGNLVGRVAELRAIIGRINDKMIPAEACDHCTKGAAANPMPVESSR